MPALWFTLVFLLARPLANGPVADSWIYLRAVKRLDTGMLSLPGFTAAIPVAQIAYGWLWGRVFGLAYPSLDLSVAVLGAGAAMLFNRLARRCGAGRRRAALATALLIVNPCFLFLSFSFMTDVPFLALVVAAYLVFAGAQEGRPALRLWVCAGLLLGAFMVRPFALAILAGCAAAASIDIGREARRLGDRTAAVLPFAAASAFCLLIWLWLTAVMPVPWMLGIRESRLTYLGLVPARVYVIDGLIAPLLYLGLVLSPLSIVHLASPRWRCGLAIAAALALIALPLLLTDRGAESIPELSCCGGWNNVLVLRGPMRFLWHSRPLRLTAIAVSILGAAGLATAARAVRVSGSGFAAVMLGTALYWAGMVPLWLFNDRYYLVMLPAGCLILAMAPFPRARAVRALSLAMLGVFGWFAAAGVYDQQRGLDAVMAARDNLIRHGIPRAAIDAGYPLNGNDLYRDPPAGGAETFALEAGIPLITSSRWKPYTFCLAPRADSVIVSRFQWPGIFGRGRRSLYVIKTSEPAALAYQSTSEKALNPTDYPPRAGPARAAINLLAMALVMATPLLATAAWLFGADRSD